MKFLHSHYEKIVFGIILLFISFLFLLTTTQEISMEEPTGFRAAAPFDVEQVGNELKFKFAFDQNLMPGDRITVFVEDEEFTLTVQKVLFPRRSEVEVLKKMAKLSKGGFPAIKIMKFPKIGISKEMYLASKKTEIPSLFLTKKFQRFRVVLSIRLPHPRLL